MEIDRFIEEEERQWIKEDDNDTIRLLGVHENIASHSNEKEN